MAFILASFWDVFCLFERTKFFIYSKFVQNKSKNKKKLIFIHKNTYT